MVGDRKSIKTSIGRHGSRTIENQHWSLMDFISTYTSSSPATLQIPTAGIAFSLLTSFTREVLDYKMLIQRYFTLSEVPIDRLKHLLAEESVSLCGSCMAAGGFTPLFGGRLCLLHGQLEMCKFAFPWYVRYSS